jgi:hypothetical protein
METGQYKHLLLTEGQELLAELGAEGRSARGLDADPAYETARTRASMTASKGDLFRKADSQWRLREQVRDVLKRIEGDFRWMCVANSPIKDPGLLIA